MVTHLTDAALSPAGRPYNAPAITVVSGLPRSGTSLMMRMLEAGGMPVLTDGVRAADPDNPLGYYEFERVKALPKGDYGWLPEAQGKAVKIISALLEHLPAGYRYRVLFMQRHMAEILASQHKMLIRRGEPVDALSDEQMAQLFEKHLRKVKAWLSSQAHIQVLDVDYNTLIAEPVPLVEQINAFLGGGLDVTRMIAVVDPQLYRNRVTTS